MVEGFSVFSGDGVVAYSFGAGADSLIDTVIENKVCHSERSEESRR